MKEVFLIVDIIFFESAKKIFNFPIENSIRCSFWLAGSEYSTFSEIRIQNEQLDVWKVHRLEIKIIERDFLQAKVAKGVEFEVGIYPIGVAYGRIIEIQ